METGRWRCPADQSVVDRLFPDRGEFCLYDVATMESESRAHVLNPTPLGLGEADRARPPGDIDPKLEVFVADLGIGWDQPIVLDYRVSLGQPRVLTLQWGPRARNNRWIEVAPTIRAFAEMVGL